MTDEPRMRYFAMLTKDEQLAAMRRLKASKFSYFGIAAATGISVEQVKAILKAEAPAPT
jgi:hypothetical protein